MRDLEGETRPREGTANSSIAILSDRVKKPRLLRRGRSTEALSALKLFILPVDVRAPRSRRLGTLRESGNAREVTARMILRLGPFDDAR